MVAGIIVVAGVVVGGSVVVMVVLPVIFVVGLRVRVRDRAVGAKVDSVGDGVAGILKHCLKSRSCFVFALKHFKHISKSFFVLMKV